MNKPKFGLIGYPLSHSFSPNFFKKKFEQLKIEESYHLFPLEEISLFTALCEENPQFTGLNVTVPYKEVIIPFLDELDESAKAIGAVNTILFKEGKKVGYNTDAHGFKQSMKPFLEPKHNKALILGTGGASKAVAYVFEQMGIPYWWASRNPSSNKEVAYTDLSEEAISNMKLIVNCTPLGTFPNTAEHPDIPYSGITENHFVIDLVYNPPKTVYLSKAEDMGAIVLNGYDMLVQQAEKAWEIWTKS